MGGKKNFFTPLLNIATLGGYGGLLKAKEAAKQAKTQNQQLQDEMNKMAEAQNKNIISDQTDMASSLLSKNKNRKKGLLGTFKNNSMISGGNSGL